MPTDPTDAQEAPAPTTRSRRRLRRSGRSMVRLGAVLTAVALIVALLAGWATRSMLDHLRDNSAELVDGSATVTLREGDERTLYITGGLVAPGETVPVPVEALACDVVGPDDAAVPFNDLASQGKRVGFDSGLARLQVVGDFRAGQDGAHTITCNGLGVVVAPEVGPASAVARLGALALGSLGTFLGLTMLLIGGALLLFSRPTDDEADEEEVDELDQPPAGTAEEWWEEESEHRDVSAVTETGAVANSGDGEQISDHTMRASDDFAEDRASDDFGDDRAPDDYVDVSEEELAALSDEEIDELVRSGALVFMDDEDDQDSDTQGGPARQ